MALNMRLTPEQGDEAVAYALHAGAQADEGLKLLATATAAIDYTENVLSHAAFDYDSRSCNRMMKTGRIRFFRGLVFTAFLFLILGPILMVIGFGGIFLIRMIFEMFQG